MWRYVPNCITCVRIIGALALVLPWLDPRSVEFLIIYSVCGVSDALDGFIARMTHSTSKLGNILDSIADLVFYAVMLYRVFPGLLEILPYWVWIMTAIAVAIRVGSYLVTLIKYRRFAAQHTYFNKATGLCMFLVPYMLRIDVLAVGYCVAVCIVGGLASTEELLIHLTQKEYIPEQKTLFYKKKQSVD